MTTIDLTFLQDAPDEKPARGELTVEPLAPLSMTTSVPGKHYQAALAPPERQLYGLIENAMGLHFGWKDYTIRQNIADDAAADVNVSGAKKRNYQPIVAPYYDFELIETPETETFDDVQWAHKWRDSSETRKGAMHHDWRATQDDAGHYGYGKTLVQREYVTTDGPWIYAVRSTSAALEALVGALDDPRGALYLGTNDGWVHATIER